MTRSKEAMAPECCMCGDHGFSLELFQCKVCQFRSQHSYCSNQYPKPEANQVCNWCLSQDGTTQKSQNSSNSSPSRKNNSMDDGKIKKKNRVNNRETNHGDLKGQRALQPNSSIMKPKSSERSPSTRKGIVTSRLDEKVRSFRSAESLTRSKSEISYKHVTRNRVRRYKLLDEVSS